LASESVPRQVLASEWVPHQGIRPANPSYARMVA
jgi:hypothetical protein